MKREDYEKSMVSFNEKSDDVARMLKDAVKKILNVQFKSPVHVPVIGNRDCYIDVDIVCLRWNNDTFIAIDSEDYVWHENDFLPCIYNKFLNLLLEQKPTCLFEESDMLPINQDLLHRTIADIAYNIGWEHHNEMDNQKMVEYIVEWAKEFEKIYRQTDWRNTADYLETVDDFCSQKIIKFTRKRL